MASLLEYVGYVHIYLGPYRGNPIALYLKRSDTGCRICPKAYPWNDVVGIGETPNKAAADFEEKWKGKGLTADMYSGPSWEGGIKPEKPAPSKPAVPPKPPTTAPPGSAAPTASAQSKGGAAPPPKPPIPPKPAATAPAESPPPATPAQSTEIVPSPPSNAPKPPVSAGSTPRSETPPESSSSS